jgi:hypothetical protein
VGVCEVLAFRAVSERPRQVGCGYCLLWLGEFFGTGVRARNHMGIVRSERGVNYSLDSLSDQFRLVLHDPVATFLR